jgi:hypothetical protein
MVSDFTNIEDSITEFVETDSDDVCPFVMTGDQGTIVTTESGFGELGFGEGPFGGGILSMVNASTEWTEIDTP